MTANAEIVFEIPFAKFHGLGNDFIVLDAKSFFKLARGPICLALGPEVSGSAPLLNASTLSRFICQRNRGIGADGLLVMFPPSQDQHHGRMLVFNADGSMAEMSGNGIRCAAAYLLDNACRRWKSDPKDRVSKSVSRLRKLEIETVAGMKWLQVVKAEERRWVFRVGMGEPILQAEKIPFKAGDFPSPAVGFPLDTTRGVLKVTVTSMGNPHCTVFVPDFDALDWERLGREIENSELFPNRTNVEFVRVISRNEIDARFWERGVGKTQSSGTGSCAAVVASVLNGLTNRKVRVRTLAGSLRVSWPKGEEVALTGPVELTARGTYYFNRARDLLLQ